MLNITIAAVSLVLAKKLLTKALRLPPEPDPPPPAGPTIVQALQTVPDDTRPAELVTPGVTRVRGAWRTSAEAVTAWTHKKPGVVPLRVCGVDFDAGALMDKLSIIWGKAGTGKTSLMQLATWEVAKLLFDKEKPVAENCRLVVIDPTGMYRDLVWSLPNHVEIFDLSLDSKDGYFWDCAGDLKDETDVINFILALQQETARQNSEPFWDAKKLEYLKAIIGWFVQSGLFGWRFSDPIKFLKYAEFAEAAIAQNPWAASFVANDLQGRLGRDIRATVTSVTDRYTGVAAFDQQATHGLPMTEFIKKRNAVLYVSFPQKLVKSAGPYVSVMLETLVNLLLRRQVRKGEEYTFFVLDEGVYLRKIEALSDLTLKGRGSGAGALLSLISLPAAERSFSPEWAKEIKAQGNLNICLACDADTAKSFSEMVGTVESLVESTNQGTTQGTSYTYSHGGGPGGTNWSQSWGNNTGTSQGTTTSLQVRPALLDGEILQLGTPDNAARPGYVQAFVHNSNTGFFFSEVFLPDEFARTSIRPAPPREIRESKELQPPTLADLRRIGLEVTPEMATALRVTEELLKAVRKKI